VAWNPAGITQLPGTQIMVGMTAIQPSGTVDTVDRFGIGRSTDVDKHTWANPHAYLTHQFSDNLWGGIGIFSRFGLGNSYPTNWPGRENLKYVSLKTVSLNPNLAFKINDNLSLAVGLEFMYATMLMKKDGDLGKMTGSPLLSGRYDQQMLTGSSIAPGFNLAAHYKFNDEWAAGLTYRSRVKQAVRGHVEFENKNPVPGLVNLPNSDLHGNLNLPDTISFGVMWKPMETLSFEAGTVYTVWSNYRSLNIHMDNPQYGTAYSPKNWRDTWGFNVSAEYKALDWLTLRGGYVFETSPMKDSTCDYMTPSNGRHRITAGVGFNWDQWTVDLAYGYLIIKELSYDKSTADGVLKGRSHNGSSHIAAVSVGYKF
jgi:long-chain fatty acid transport protein